MRKKTQRFRFAAAGMMTGALLVPLAVFGGTGAAKSSSAAEYQYKITICHHTHSTKNPSVTISVSLNAWPAHKKHGDTMGACPPKVPLTTTTHGASSNGKSNGNSGNHGNSSSHGNGHSK
jgi:hypothetical protein